jgi:flagellar basal-body rod modification protein FlgD
MSVSSVLPTAAGGGSAAPLTSQSPSLQQADFLKLLTTQLRYQNPLEPLNNADFMSQMAQFSTLDGIQKLNTNFGDLMLMQGLTQGASLIGTTISYDKDGSGKIAKGAVASIKVDAGKVQLVVGGNLVALSQVRGIEAARTAS